MIQFSVSILILLSWRLVPHWIHGTLNSPNYNVLFCSEGFGVCVSVCVCVMYWYVIFRTHYQAFQSHHSSPPPFYPEFVLFWSLMFTCHLIRHSEGFSAVYSNNSDSSFQFVEGVGCVPHLSSFEISLFIIGFFNYLPIYYGMVIITINIIINFSQECKLQGARILTAMQWSLR